MKLSELKKAIREVVREEIGFLKKDLINESLLVKVDDMTNKQSSIIKENKKFAYDVNDEIPIGENPFMDFFKQTAENLSAAELNNFNAG